MESLNALFEYTTEGIIIANQSGAIIQTYKFNGPKNTINIEFLPTGLYFLQLNNSKGEIHIIKINKI